MKRVSINPRPNWQSLVEAKGLVYHTGEDSRVYWNEAAYYHFTSDEVDTLEAATKELHELCVQAAGYAIENNRLADFGIPPTAFDAIKWSWKQREPSVYGRFDLAFDGINPPKMLEYNADTPTALVEAAVAQWYWLQDVFPHHDQFNSIWESLIERWRVLAAQSRFQTNEILYFACGTDLEDAMTITALRDTAEQAGIRTAEITMREIGWDSAKRVFVDERERAMRQIFKLYPWEWMLSDEFGRFALETYNQVRWIEPIWKFVLSSKAILPLLWEMFPQHPNLLAAYADSPRDLTEYVEKPVISREGANISIHTAQGQIATGGDYDDYPKIYQQFYPFPNFDGNTAVIGSWIIGDEPHGIGVREADSWITDNRSRFVPHIFE